MVDSKYSIVLEWLKSSVLMNNWVYFNTLEVNQGNVSVNSSEERRRKIKYVDGSYETSLPLEVSIVTDYSTDQTDINVKCMYRVEKVMEWIDETEDYPDFGPDTLIRGISVDSNTPSVFVDIENRRAKYVFTFTIDYLQMVN